MENNGSQTEDIDIVSLSIFGGLCAFISMFVIIGTIFENFSRNVHSSQCELIFASKEEDQKFDYKEEGESRMKQLLLAFSIHQNMKKIFSVETTGGDSISVFHGIKFLAMIWIILTHSLSFSKYWMNFSK